MLSFEPVIIINRAILMGPSVQGRCFVQRSVEKGLKSQRKTYPLNSNSDVRDTIKIYFSNFFKFFEESFFENRNYSNTGSIPPESVRNKLIPSLKRVPFDMDGKGLNVIH